MLHDQIGSAPDAHPQEDATKRPAKEPHPELKPIVFWLVVHQSPLVNPPQAFAKYLHAASLEPWCGRDQTDLAAMENMSRPDIEVAFSPAEEQTTDMAKTPKKAKRAPSAAFMKPVQPDEKLALVVGDKPLPRTDLTKKLWTYIKKNGLQDAKKKTLINADPNLKAVFNGKKQVSMFEMTKLVSGHLKK
jgi:hypothetical protein